MKITYLKLKGYKYIDHGGIVELDMQVSDTPLMVFIGNNGSGKSTVLMQLAPTPPLSSMFFSNGLKVLKLDHNEHKYELTANFASSKLVHSFIKDGVELNTSGNRATAVELCISELGYTEVVNDLVLPVTTMTDMTPTVRQVLLLYTYPDDLSFITPMYKDVKSKISATKANIKLMLGRKATLEGQLLPESNRVELEERRNIFKKALHYLDKQQHLCETYLNGITPTATIAPTEPPTDEILKQLSWAKSKYSELFDTIPMKEHTHVLQSEIAGLASQMTELEAEIHTIVESINEQEVLSKTDVSTEIFDIEKRICQLQEDLTQVPDTTIPILTGEELVTLESEIYPQVKTITDSLYGGSYITLNQLETNMTQGAELKAKCDALSYEIAELTTRVTNSKLALRDEMELHYPNSCKLTCPLKNHKDKVIKQLNSTISELSTKLVSNTKNIEAHEKVLGELKSSSVGSHTQQANIRILDRLLTATAWGKWVLRSKTLNRIINEDCYYLVNSIIKIVTNSNVADKHKVASLENEKLELRLDILKTTKKTMDKFASENLIIEKERQVTQVKKYDVLKKKHDKCTEQLQVANKVHELTTLLEGELLTNEQYLKDIEQEYVSGAYSQYLRWVAQDRALIENELLSVTNTLDSQLVIFNTLHKEVLVLLESLYMDAKDLSLIEKHLSPVYGLPSKYMKGYINFLIDEANKYIGKVWSYPMVIKHIDDSDKLDYTFKVVINGDSVVSDMKVCSTAQKGIINFAWRLALHSQLDLVDYPICADELDSGFTDGHRVNLGSLLGSLVSDNVVDKLYLIGHHSSLYNAFASSQTLMLSDTGVVGVDNVNEGIVIKRK